MKVFAKCRESLQNFCDRSTKQKLQILFVLLISFVLVWIINHFPELAWFLLAVTLLILMMIVWSFAGVVVFKPLFLVSAELSLLIFLAQSYCEVPKVTPTSDEALKSLLLFGLLYIAALFLRSMTKELKTKLTTLREIDKSTQPVFVVFIFVIFVTIFLIQLYQVIVPIIFNLCIYKR